MKKFGIGKKDKSDDAAEDQSRSRLFGKSKKDKSSPAPPSINPYAQPPGGHSSKPDPYGSPTQASINSSYPPSVMSYQSEKVIGGIANAPPPYASSQRQQRPGDHHGFIDERNDSPGFPSKSPVPPGGYGGGPSQYGNNSYGVQQGYGGDRFGGEGAFQPPQRPGGYGGLGRTFSQDTQATDAARNELFGSARDRVEAKQQHEQQQGLPQEEQDAPGSGFNAGISGAGGYSEYGQYHERALTAEEEEEEDVRAAKDQIKFLKQQDVASTRNALRIAAQAEETGRATLERLGQQGESIHNAEKNLDLAANQNRLAEEKARELKHLNRSMWAMQVNNPFTKQRRLREMDEKIMDTHHAERAERSATRAVAFQQQARAADAERTLRGPTGQPVKKKNLAERAKYQFEADSEDEALEDEIDTNLDALSGAAGRLNALGRAMGREVDEQNKHIDRITGKADKVDDQIVMNRARLDRIR